MKTVLKFKLDRIPAPIGQGYKGGRTPHSAFPYPRESPNHRSSFRMVN